MDYTVFSDIPSFPAAGVHVIADGCSEDVHSPTGALLLDPPDFVVLVVPVVGVPIVGASKEALHLVCERSASFELGIVAQL